MERPSGHRNRKERHESAAVAAALKTTFYSKIVAGIYRDLSGFIGIYMICLCLSLMFIYAMVASEFSAIAAAALANHKCCIYVIMNSFHKKIKK